MMRNQLFLYFLFVFSLLTCDIHSQELITYMDIPGRSNSDHYTCRVKFLSEPESAWREVFVLQTQAKDNGDDAYFEALRGWTASWIAFESDFNGEEVVVEISKKDNTAITKAMVRPVGEAIPVTIQNGKAYVTFSEPANINVDINGQLEDNYTGYGYDGPNVHTITLFANPIFERPDESLSNVKVLQPEEDINTLNRDDWDTIIFAPGVHDIGMSFQILSNETLFIPGDAIVKGTIHPKNAWNNNASMNFKVYGSGTISGEDIVRDRDDKGLQYKPFTYQAEGAHLEGFVVADPAFHTFNMGHSRGSGAKNIYKNLKILAWRVNSDAINAFRNSEVYDCFFRVQDDAFYFGQSNVNQHDNVVWNDANGAVLFLQNVVDGSTCTFSDVKVIYHRAYWHWWSGGRIISMRELEPGKSISNVHVQNIFVEDPLPAFPPFYGVMNDGDNDDVTLNNIVFENIRQEHDGVTSSLDDVRGKPRNTLQGLDSDRRFKNILFKNCYFNGKDLNSFEDGNFLKEFVDENTVLFQTNSDVLISIDAPDKVAPDETIQVSVNYKASEQRDLRAFIQLNENPWTPYGSSTITIDEGEGSETISFTVDNDIPLLNNAYKIVVNLLPVGGNWSDRLDELSIFNISAVQSTLSALNFESIGLSLYPNPTSDFAYLKSDYEIYKIKLFNSASQLIIEKNIDSRVHQLNLSSLSSGMYFLHVFNEKGSAISKLIVP